jgi:hypothetical protein
MPPRSIGMATGPEGGGEYEIGKQYQALLARAGVTLKLVATAGSVENLALLRDSHSGVSIALVQGGSVGKAAGDLESLGTLFYEPLWIFHRGGLEGGTMASAATSKALTEAARTLGLDIAFFHASTSDEIDAAFAAFARERLDALFIAPEGFFASRRAQFVTLAARDRIPASFATREMAEAGLLMSYGVDFADTFRQVGNYVGRILNGERPSELPVVQSAKFELVINLRTAKALGLTVPPSLLSTADEVIE